MALAGAVLPPCEGLFGSQQGPPFRAECLSLLPGILCPDPGTGDAAAGGGWLSPGATPHCLPPPPPPLLHPTCETGNHKHPSQLCERTYIFSTHSIQHSKKSYRFLKKKQTPSFQNNHRSLRFTPHPTALTLDLLAQTRQPAASDPAPRCPCPARVRGWPQLSGSTSCHGTSSFCRAWGPRMLLPEGPALAPVPSRAVFQGKHTPRKTESGAGSGCQPGQSSRSLAGAGHGPRVVPGRRGDPSLMPGGPQADRCDGISAAFCRRWGTRRRRGRQRHSGRDGGASRALAAAHGGEVDQL